MTNLKRKLMAVGITCFLSVGAFAQKKEDDKRPPKPNSKVVVEPKEPKREKPPQNNNQGGEKRNEEKKRKSDPPDLTYRAVGFEKLSTAVPEGPHYLPQSMHSNAGSAVTRWFRSSLLPKPR